MELTPLRYILAIAEAGHMTRAAQSLGVTQPTLSAMLKKLESEAGAELFYRSARGVTPTEAGKVFIEHAMSAVRSADMAVSSVRELAGLETGAVRLGGGATAMLELMPGVIGRMRREHPGLRFHAREAGSAAVARGVLSGELDLGVVTLPVRVPGAEDLLHVMEFTDELRLIVPPEHPLAGVDAFRWSDLAGASIVAFESGSAVREVIDSAAASAGVTLNVVVELRSIQSIQRMVKAGIGVGFVSRFSLAKDKGLSCADGELHRTMALVRRGDRIPAHAAAAFEKEFVESVRWRIEKPGAAQPRAARSA